MTLVDRLASVDAAIGDAAREAGRDPAALTRIVVTKFHPASLVRELVVLGVRDVGENRHQEAEAKAAEVADPELRWHFIGQLQRNKARAVRSYAASVHSVDRPSLADALARAGDGESRLDVFLELNLTPDPDRGGIDPVRVESLVEHVLALPSLRLRGVMAVAPLAGAPADAFARLAASADAVRRVVPDARWMSAGMSGDFAEAIAAGATHLRIGTAITGPRPEHG